MKFTLFCISLFLFAPAYTENTNRSGVQCLAVVDVGSTGSRLHVYEYELDPNNSPINIHETSSNKVNPGYASMPLNETDLQSYLDQLFSKTNLDHVPVYFYATAGMRLLPQSKQKNYYQAVQRWFAQHPQTQLAGIKTITGNDEALYDWLAVNYHLGTLQKNQTVGVMDIGGASVQIAFTLAENQDNSTYQSSKFKIYGKEYTLFTHSFLGLGQNEMAHQMQDAPACFANNYPLSDGEHGQGNAVECAHEIEPLINGVHKINTTVQNALASNPVNTWYALGGISYLAGSTPFTFHNNQLTNFEFLNQANQITCQTSWESLNNQFPNNDFVDAYCLLPAFYYALMVDGYGIEANKSIHFFPSQENIDWTIGVVLVH